jgi:hypothetical protein
LSDMADKGWLQDGNAKAGIWSALHFQYSLASAQLHYRWFKANLSMSRDHNSMLRPRVKIMLVPQLCRLRLQM